MTELTGTSINERYVIENKIGSGGMAEVFKAYDLIEKRHVAVKLIKKEYCADPQYMRRFEREARTVLNLKHKNIVGAYEYGTYAGRSYIVLEYVEGCTLKEYILKNGALDPKIAVKLLAKVLDALEYAHEQGYIHRDVKPQNVLITEDKLVKLTDFGIAKGTDSQTRTYDGSHVIGSVHYISPEQAKGEDVGKESDLYSVGIMLYELLVGKPPFEGDNSVQIAIKHINDTFVLPEEVNTKVPPALNDVLMKATAKNREKRYHSAADMKKDLIRALTQPKKHFVFIDDEPLKADTDTGGEQAGKARLWHIILPVAFMLLLVVSIFTAWYVNMISNSSDNPRIPKLLGMDAEEASKLVRNRDYKMIVAGEIASDEYPKGTVCKQTPEAGTPKEAGSTIEVIISAGSETILMVDLTGKSLEEAALLLSEMEIGIGSVSYLQSDAEPGTIIWQSVPANDEVVRGDTVDVQISGTADVQVEMPDLTVKSINYAVMLLKIYEINDYGIRIASEDELDPNKTYANKSVILQTPSVGMPVTPSSTHVELVVYLNKEKAAHADFSNEIMVPADDSRITVTVLSQLGEVTIYETSLNEGMQLLEFDMYYIEQGRYTCLVYIDNVEMLHVEKIFYSKAFEEDLPALNSEGSRQTQ